MTQNLSLEEHLAHCSPEDTEEDSFAPLSPSDTSRSRICACLVDTIANTPYSVIAGAVVDFISGFAWESVCWSRLNAIPVSLAVNPFYGLWREVVYVSTGTHSGSSLKRRYFSDILAYNSCRTFLHGVVVAAGSLMAEGKVDWQSVANGLILLAALSPVTCLIANEYMDFFRRRYHVNTPLQGVYLKKPH